MKYQGSFTFWLKPVEFYLFDKWASFDYAQDNSPSLLIFYSLIIKSVYLCYGFIHLIIVCNILYFIKT